MMGISRSPLAVDAQPLSCPCVVFSSALACSKSDEFRAGSQGWRRFASWASLAVLVGPSEGCAAAPSDPAWWYHSVPLNCCIDCRFLCSGYPFHCDAFEIKVATVLLLLLLSCFSCSSRAYLRAGLLANRLPPPRQRRRERRRLL